MTDIYMEEVHGIGLAALQVIQDRLKLHNIVLTTQQEDDLYVPIINAIEKIAHFPDYRSMN